MSEKLITGLFDWLIAQGWAGVLIIGMGITIWRQWKDNQSLKADVTTARAETAAIQEKRIAEGRENLIALQANTSALTTLSQVIGVTGRS